MKEKDIKNIINSIKIDNPSISSYIQKSDLKLIQNNIKKTNNLSLSNKLITLNKSTNEDKNLNKTNSEISIEEIKEKLINELNS